MYVKNTVNIIFWVSIITLTLGKILSFLQICYCVEFVKLPYALLLLMLLTC